MVHTVRRQCVFDPQLGSVRMCTTIKDGGSADLIGGSVLGNDQLDILITLKDLVDAVM